MVSDNTRLLFCTTRVLLRRLQSDAELSKVTHVIVDEVHERDLQSEFLLVVLKQLLVKRSELKLVLMSATADSDLFCNYFHQCPQISVPGRLFPIETLHLEDTFREPEPTVAPRLEDLEREHIESVLQSCQWKIKGKDGAAACLGLAPSTLRDRMKKHGIVRKAPK